MSQKKSDELLALYCFYAKTACIQKTQSIYATNGFTAKGLGWNINKVIRVKRRLIDLKLVDPKEREKGEDGKFKKPYIIVRYVKFTGVVDSDTPAFEYTGNQLHKCSSGKDSVERRNQKKEYSHSLERVKVVEDENQARIINLYHQKLCGPGSDFLPITELSPELRKVLEVFENTDDESLTEIFEDAKRYHERTLVRILWDNY